MAIGSGGSFAAGGGAGAAGEHRAWRAGDRRSGPGHRRDICIYTIQPASRSYSANRSWARRDRSPSKSLRLHSITASRQWPSAVCRFPRRTRPCPRSPKRKSSPSSISTSSVRTRPSGPSRLRCATAGADRRSGADAQRDHAEEHPDDRPHRCRQDRDRAPAGTAGRMRRSSRSRRPSSPRSATSAAMSSPSSAISPTSRSRWSASRRWRAT
jgi:hypothetical protein